MQPSNNTQAGGKTSPALFLSPQSFSTALAAGRKFRCPKLADRTIGIVNLSRIRIARADALDMPGNIHIRLNTNGLANNRYLSAGRTEKMIAGKKNSGYAQRNQKS